jgi:hypothetical protein
LAINFDISSEMKAPPKPITAEKTSSMPRFKAVGGQEAIDAEQAGEELSTSITARLVARKSTRVS